MRSHPGIQSECDLEFLFNPHDNQGMHNMNREHSASNSAMPSLSQTQSYYREASDEELLAAARSSDDRAFAELSGRYRKSIHNTASRIVRNREDAEDVVQDAFFKAYIHLKHFRGTCRFSTWLTKIAVNSALMLLRKRRIRPEVSFEQRANQDQTREMWDFPDQSPNPEQVYAKCQALELLSRAMTRLPPGLSQRHDPVSRS